MTEQKRLLWPLLLVVALVQSAALFKMVYDRDRLIKTGREITIPTQPLDPRDIFRGDYVTLGYDLSSLRKSAVAQGHFDDLRTGYDAYVTLTPNPAGGWKPIDVTPDYPRQVAATDVVLKGRVKTLWNDQNQAETVAGLRYGIEAYFVSEGTGQALENKVRDRKIEAIVSVGADGTAALKGLVVDGERHVDPPLL